MPVAFIAGKPLERHPSYDSQARARDFWRRSDRASHTFVSGKDANGNDILPKLPAEDEDDYSWRRKLAVSPRFVSSIISLYNSLLTRGETARPKGTEGQPYALLQEDADGMGMPLPVLMARAVRKAQVESVSYLLADTDAGDDYATQAEALGARARPIIRRIGADQVVWWRDWLGEVVEAVVMLCDPDGREFGWYVTESTQQRIELKADESGSLTVVGMGPIVQHTYGGCPLVRVTALFGDTDDPGDDSQAAPVAEQQRLITALQSLEMIEVHKSTFSMWAFIGVDAKMLSEGKAGSGRGFALPLGADVKSMGSDPAQANSIRMSMQTAMQRMFLAAGLSPGNPLETGAPESGAAKAFKYNETESRLAALAAAAEHAENTVRARALAGVSADDAGDAKWPREFMTPDVESELDVTIKALTSSLPSVLKDAQVRRYADKAYELTPEQNAQMETQLKAAETQRVADAANPFVNPTAARTSGT